MHASLFVSYLDGAKVHGLLDYIIVIVDLILCNVDRLLE